MNSLLMSIGKIFLYPIFVGFVVSCATNQKSVEIETEELSLDGDKKKLEKMRENIPKEIRETNDSLKEILKNMGELKVHPQKVRENFDKLQRKQRTTFQKDQRKTRDKYTNLERKSREEFLKQQKELRDDARKKEMEREERSEFYADLDVRRREFFSEQRDKRKEFESDLKEKNNDFYHELTSQRKEFNEEWKSYSQRWQEWQKSKKNNPLRNLEMSNSKTSNSDNFFSPQEAAEFERLNKSEGEREKLSTEDN